MTHLAIDVALLALLLAVLAARLLRRISDQAFHGLSALIGAALTLLAADRGQPLMTALTAVATAVFTVLWCLAPAGRRR